jgi:hypothetical protein
LTLEEALQTFKYESQLFRLQLRIDPASPALNEEKKFIKIRKEKVMIEGNERTIIMIRDVSDFL